jgi:hypothetical protein
MEKHTYGHDWYDYITENITNRMVRIQRLISKGKTLWNLSTIALELLRLYFSLKTVPKPTKDNTNWANTHYIISIRDEFMTHENNKGRRQILEMIFNLLIIKYDYDPYYRKRIDYVLDKLATPPANWVSKAYQLKSDQWWKQ